MDRVGGKTVNLIYTVCIFINHFAFGITSNTIWAPLEDLSHIYRTSVDALSYLGTFSSLGYLIGSLSGCLYKWINRQLVLSILVICIGVTMAFMPYYYYVPLLYGAMTLNGMGGGSWDSSNNVWLVEMWPTKSASVVQASQFMYGLGTIVGPLLMAPYIHDDNNGTDLANQTITSEERQELLQTPFAMIGSFQTIVPIIFLILFVAKRYRKVETNDKRSSSEDDESQVVDSINVHQESVVSIRPNRKLKLFLVAACLATYDTAEIGYFFYSTTMLRHIENPLSGSEATHVLSVLSAAYTAGRLITAFIALKVKPDNIITYHFVIVILAQATLFLGRDHKNVIYIGTVMLGYGFSAMWPSILAFTERHLKLSDRVGSLLFFFAGFVSMFTPFIIGRFLTSAPLVLFIFEAGYLGISLILFAILRLFYLKT